RGRERGGTDVAGQEAGLRGKIEPVQVIKQRRDAALARLVGGLPYAQFLGVRFDRRGAELTAVRPYDAEPTRHTTRPARLVGGLPYAQFLGVRFDRRGDELTAILPYDEKLIGNPYRPALHGGAIGAFLEISAIVELSWTLIWEAMEGSGDAGGESGFPAMP